MLPVSTLDRAAERALSRYMTGTLAAIGAVAADLATAPAYRIALKELRLFWFELARAAVVARRNSILGFVIEASGEG